MNRTRKSRCRWAAALIERRSRNADLQQRRICAGTARSEQMKISCIDIGGTYIKSGVLEDGVLTDVEETPTDGGGGARAMLSRVAQLVRQTPGVERGGVSTAGEVDARTGVIRPERQYPRLHGAEPAADPGEAGPAGGCGKRQ